MTAYRCWIELPNDKPLQLRIQRGELGEPGSCPLQSIPAPPNDTCWPAVLIGWCRERKLSPIDQGLTVKVKVKKAQIEDFIDYVYGGSDFYSTRQKCSPGRAMLIWPIVSTTCARASRSSSARGSGTSSGQTNSEKSWRGGGSGRAPRAGFAS